MACAAIAEAKNNLPKLIHEAEGGSHVELSRHGKSVAVILSFTEYVKLREAKNAFSSAYGSFKQKWRNFYMQGASGDFTVFEGLRQIEAGRSVEL